MTCHFEKGRQRDFHDSHVISCIEADTKTIDYCELEWQSKPGKKNGLPTRSNIQ